MKRPLSAVFTLALLTGTAFAQAPMSGPSMSGPSMRGPSMQGPAMQGPSMAGPMMKGPAANTEWRKGGTISLADWNRGHAVDDWREHKLHAAPAGQEWRHVDRSFLLVISASHEIVEVLDAGHEEPPRR